MCKHVNLTITETGTWFTQHYRESDGTWWHNNEPGDYQDKISVKCNDCGLERDYYKNRVPNWLQSALDDSNLARPNGERR